MAESKMLSAAALQASFDRLSTAAHDARCEGSLRAVESHVAAQAEEIARLREVNADLERRHVDLVDELSSGVWCMASGSCPFTPPQK